MTILKWILGLLWVALFAIGGISLERRKMSFEMTENFRHAQPPASHCDSLALRQMPAGYRLGEQDIANASGPVVKLAGKYAARDLAKGERVCEQDLLAQPRVTIGPGFAGVLIPITPGPLNAGATVDVKGPKAFALDGVRVAAVLCNPNCNQALIEVPEAKVASLVGETQVAVIRALP